MEKKYSRQTKGKKCHIAILISDKIDFKTRVIKRDPEDHFIIFKGRIHQEDINIINIYATNIGAPKYIKVSLGGLQERYKQQHTYSRVFEHPTVKNG